MKGKLSQTLWKWGIPGIPFQSWDVGIWGCLWLLMWSGQTWSSSYPDENVSGSTSQPNWPPDASAFTVELHSPISALSLHLRHKQVMIVYSVLWVPHFPTLGLAQIACSVFPHLLDHLCRFTSLQWQQKTEMTQKMERELTHTKSVIHSKTSQGPR